MLKGSSGKREKSKGQSSDTSPRSDISTQLKTITRYITNSLDARLAEFSEESELDLTGSPSLTLRERLGNDRFRKGTPCVASSRASDVAGLSSSEASELDDLKMSRKAQEDTTSNDEESDLELDELVLQNAKQLGLYTEPTDQQKSSSSESKTKSLKTKKTSKKSKNRGTDSDKDKRKAKPLLSKKIEPSVSQPTVKKDRRKDRVHFHSPEAPVNLLSPSTSIAKLSKKYRSKEQPKGSTILPSDDVVNREKLSVPKNTKPDSSEDSSEESDLELETSPRNLNSSFVKLHKQDGKFSIAGSPHTNVIDAAEEITKTSPRKHIDFLSMAKKHSSLKNAEASKNISEQKSESQVKIINGGATKNMNEESSESPVMTSLQHDMTKDKSSSSLKSPKKASQREIKSATAKRKAPDSSGHPKTNVSSSDSDSSQSSDEGNAGVSKAFQSEIAKILNQNKLSSPSSKKAAEVEAATESAEDVVDGPFAEPVEFSVPDGFKAVGVAGRRGSLWYEDIKKDTELWLVRAPVGLDMSKVEGKTLLLQGVQSLGSLGENNSVYEAQASRDNIRETNNLQAVVTSKQKKKMCVVPEIRGLLSIVKSIVVPPIIIPTVPVPGPKELPKGLKARFEAFGSESPIRRKQLTLTHTIKKKKKRRHQPSESESKEVNPPEDSVHHHKRRKTKDKGQADASESESKVMYSRKDEVPHHKRTKDKGQTDVSDSDSSSETSDSSTGVSHLKVGKKHKYQRRDISESESRVVNTGEDGHHHKRRKTTSKGQTDVSDSQSSDTSVGSIVVSNLKRRKKHKNQRHDISESESKREADVHRHRRRKSRERGQTDVSDESDSTPVLTQRESTHSKRKKKKHKRDRGDFTDNAMAAEAMPVTPMKKKKKKRKSQQETSFDSESSSELSESLPDMSHLTRRKKHKRKRYDSSEGHSRAQQVQVPANMAEGQPELHPRKKHKKHRRSSMEDSSVLTDAYTDYDTSHEESHKKHKKKKKKKGRELLG